MHDGNHWRVVEMAIRDIVCASAAKAEPTLTASFNPIGRESLSAE
jgi:hypothetical protein